MAIGLSRPAAGARLPICGILDAAGVYDGGVGVYTGGCAIDICVSRMLQNTKMRCYLAEASV